MVAEPIKSNAPLQSPEVGGSLSKGRRKFISNSASDGIFKGVTMIFALSVLVIAVLILGLLLRASIPSMHKFGWKFLSTSTWDPVRNIYGAWPYIFGTLVSSFLALLLAVPIGLATAIFLSELAPKWIRTPISFMVELLAAVPSVVYGLWGLLVMVPWLRDAKFGQGWMSEFAFPFLQEREISWAKAFHAPWIEKYGLSHFVDGAPAGNSMMAGGLILAIMILPFITAVSREVLRAVPATQREAAFGLGATHWEAIKGPVLRYARGGIMGAIILGLARALGETMAVTMVIGNGNQATASLLSPGNTLASILVNQFNEADSDQLSSLMQIALILFGITIVVNALARLLIWNMARGVKGATRE